MGSVIGQILPLAIGVALSPLPIIAVILILTTPAGRTNGIAFTVGWLLGSVVACGLLSLLLNGANTAQGSPSTVARIVSLGLGLLLLLLALRQWRSRPKDGETPPMPKWMQTLDKISPLVALGLGAALSGVNPKNLLLTAGAASTIAQASLSAAQQVLAIVIFALVGALGVGIPLVVYLAGGDRSAQTLAGWRAWLGQHNAAIMAVLFLIFAVKFLGNSLTGLF
jgi:threonine/homoserine/homoserine lactone efflux protein